MKDKLVPIYHNGTPVITTELLAQVYETDTDRIKQNFNRNKDKFKEGIHYFRLEGETLKAFKNEVSFSDLVGKNASCLYLWTERGANRHCKILDTQKSWEQFDHLEETYFLVKEYQQRAVKGKTEAQIAAETKRAYAMSLNAKNRTAERFQKLWDRANVKPEYQALALMELFAEDGVKLPRIALEGTKVTYDKGTIAKMVGVFSKASGGKNPHAQAVGAIIPLLDISKEEYEAVPYSRNGHDGTDFQYTESVVKKIRAWLDCNEWPTPLSAGGKSYDVVYKK